MYAKVPTVSGLRACVFIENLLNDIEYLQIIFYVDGNASKCTLTSNKGVNCIFDSHSTKLQITSCNTIFSDDIIIQIKHLPYAGNYKLVFSDY